MKKVIGYVTVFVTVFITSALVNLPARFVIQKLPIPSQLEITGLQGTIWQGSAEQIHWENRNFGDVAWQFKPSALFGARLEVALRFGRGSELNLRGKGLVGYGLSGGYAQDTIISMPADVALTQVALPVPISAQGQLELSINQYAYQAPFCLNGHGSLAWNSANLESPLGSLALTQAVADLQCDNSTVKIKGSQKSEQVSSEFSAQLSPNYSYQAEGWFKPGAEFPQQLANQLKWLPKPNNQGNYTFKQQGRL
ncbi:type II secretion system protein N [Vibrio ziniensis]|uniref:Type II secretion system protein N n=1 Tax=Vibrio ziniensis TaxID=2711221 RepID=A0A6G7CES8_9VIBR|nr:type II secretion system protein N [Vibrio ziniensis]QIH40589.1 type II secretion system protein N [Vibrio ziniensis]